MIEPDAERDDRDDHRRATQRIESVAITTPPAIPPSVNAAATSP